MAGTPHSTSGNARDPNAGKAACLPPLPHPRISSSPGSATGFRFWYERNSASACYLPSSTRERALGWPGDDASPSPRPRGWRCVEVRVSVAGASNSSRAPAREAHRREGKRRPCHAPRGQEDSVRRCAPRARGLASNGIIAGGRGRVPVLGHEGLEHRSWGRRCVRPRGAHVDVALWGALALVA